jgi:ribonuclease D
MQKKHISSEEINVLPLKSWHGPIEVVTTDEGVKNAVEKILKHSVIGFDTESKPAFRKGEYNPVALLQMAIPEKVFIFRISHTGFTQILARVFMDRNIKKVGVAIKDDIKELQKFHNFNPSEVIDLADEADSRGINNSGLRGLTALLLGFRISKKQQTSNWENRRLTKAQINYAATDAWVCREIYNTLKKIRKGS